MLAHLLSIDFHRPISIPPPVLVDRPIDTSQSVQMRLLLKPAIDGAIFFLATLGKLIDSPINTVRPHKHY